jgi:hypothetical protein
MRQHVVAGFPDPRLSAPPNPADHSAVIRRHGVVVAIPRSIGTGSPPFTRAATACKLPPRQVVTHLAPFPQPASLSPPEKREDEDEADAETDD